MIKPTTPLRFMLDLHGHGWATFRLSVDGVHDEVGGVSYLGDPLATLLEAAVSVSLRRTGEFVLHQEPGAQRYVFLFQASGSSGEWQLHRYAYAEDLDDAELPPVDRPPAFTVRLPAPDTFAQAALALAEAIVARHGEEGYEALWDGERLPFPRRALAALRAALAIDDRRPLPPAMEDR